MKCCLAASTIAMALTLSTCGIQSTITYFAQPSFYITSYHIDTYKQRNH